MSIADSDRKEEEVYLRGFFRRAATKERKEGASPSFSTEGGGRKVATSAWTTSEEPFARGKKGRRPSPLCKKRVHEVSCCSKKKGKNALATLGGRGGRGENVCSIADRRGGGKGGE